MKKSADSIWQKIQDMFQILTPHSADKFNYAPL